MNRWWRHSVILQAEGASFRGTIGRNGDASPNVWRAARLRPILALAVCASRQERIFPGALSISKGAVPGKTRGFSHTAPTYFVGSRDRLLHRSSWIVTSIPLCACKPGGCGDDCLGHPGIACIMAGLIDNDQLAF